MLIRSVNDVDDRDWGICDCAGNPDDVVEIRVVAVKLVQAQRVQFAKALCLVVGNRRGLEAAIRRRLFEPG